MTIANEDKSGQIQKYRKRWICGECSGKDASDKEETDTDKLWTEYICLYPNCNENKNNKTWTGPNALRNWTNPYSKHHPTQEFLHITNQQFCTEINCTKIIPASQSHPHCMDHRYLKPTNTTTHNTQNQSNHNPPPTISNNNHNHNNAPPAAAANADEIIIDGDGRPYDINRIINWYDVDEKWRSEEQKQEAAKVLFCIALKLMSSRQMVIAHYNAIFGPNSLRTIQQTTAPVNRKYYDENSCLRIRNGTNYKEELTMNRTDGIEKQRKQTEIMDELKLYSSHQSMYSNGTTRNNRCRYHLH